MSRFIRAGLLAIALLAVAVPAVLAADGTELDPTTLTFAFLITPPGILAAAAFTTTFVQIVKGTFPTIDARISGLMLAFFFDAILYAFAALALVGNGTIVGADGILWIFTAWLGCVGMASGFKSAFAHIIDAPAKAQPLTDPIAELVDPIPRT